MRCAGAFLLLSAFALVGACSDNQPALPPAPDKTEKLKRFEFTIENARYAISLPEQAGMRDQRDTKSVTFDAHKTQRLQKIMVLSAVQDGQVPSPDRKHRLRNGGIVNYHRTDDAGGGSGGSMATIEGQLQIGLYTLFLYCSDQSEWALFPDWCFDHLDTLELLPGASGNR
jgi:hypothetical protein